DPQLQGYRLRGTTYQRIHPRNGRLPSQVTGLHLEQDGNQLRLWYPATQAWLPTSGELLEQTQQENQQLLQQNALLQQQLAQSLGGQASPQNEIPPRSTQPQTPTMHATNTRLIARRWFLRQCGVGLGAVALAKLLGAASPQAVDPLAPKKPHFAAKAKNVI